MKNLITTLQRGNLKPKERVLLIVQNQISKETTGKEVLSEAEIHAIDKEWQPKDNGEVKEYNAYLKGWRTVGFAELDAQTTYLNSNLAYQQEKLTNFQLQIYPFYRETKNWLDRLKEIKPVTLKEATEIANKQRQEWLNGGQDFDFVVYNLAFESLPKDIQNDLEILYEEASYDSEYLDQEEILADILRGKDKPTAEDKEKIAELIANRPYNKYANEYQFFHYFGSIPIRKVVIRWFKEKGLSPEDKLTDKEKEAVEKVALEQKLTKQAVVEGEFAENLAEIMKAYAKEHNTTVEAELKKTTIDWLDNGLLDEYEPLFISKGKKSYNGTTKHPHNELFDEWLKSKTKAREILNNLVKEKKLVVKDDGETITGDSLYNLKSDYKFVKEFKENVDNYQPTLGMVYEDNDPEHKGQNLDGELLICNKRKNGLVGLSPFHMATAKLEQFLDIVGWLKETQIDGETVVEFNNEKIKEFSKNTTTKLSENYGILLSFKELFKRLSKTYKIDLTYKINEWVSSAESFIDSHNEVIETIKNLDKVSLTKKGKSRLKDDLFIDKNKITPDFGRVGNYFNEFTEILGEDF